MFRKLALTAALLAPIAAAAQDLPTAPYLPLDMATTAAQAALAACAAEKNNVSVAIIARDGSTKVVLKADNSGPHTTASATGKAFTSAALGRDTAGLASFIAETPQKAGLRDSVIVMVGGAPVTQEYADAVGADGYAADASATVRRAKDLLNHKRSLVPA